MHVTDTVDLRPPTPADQPELERMVLALYAEDSPGEPMDVEKVRRTVAMLSVHPDKGRIRLIEVGRACAGYVIQFDFSSNEIRGDLVTIDELYLRPARRGRGLGRMVVERLMRELGPEAVGLQLEVSPSNPVAAAFYRALGFHPMRNQPLVRLREERSGRAGEALCLREVSAFVGALHGPGFHAGGASRPAGGRIREAVRLQACHSYLRKARASRLGR